LSSPVNSGWDVSLIEDLNVTGILRWSESVVLSSEFIIGQVSEWGKTKSVGVLGVGVGSLDLGKVGLEDLESVLGFSSGGIMFVILSDPGDPEVSGLVLDFCLEDLVSLLVLERIGERECKVDR